MLALIGELRADVGGRARILPLPIPHDCLDGFGEAYWAWLADTGATRFGHDECAIRFGYQLVVICPFRGRTSQR